MKHNILTLAVSCLAIGGVSLPALSAGISVDMNKVTASGVGEKIGTTVISEKAGGGLEFKVDITEISPGEHGFHLHTTGDCSPAMKDGKAVAGLAAGPHYDPASTKSHKGPTVHGHKGDLPFLTATDKGINVVVSAPHLLLSDVLGRSLIVHDGGDNYTDHPENGGGMGRSVCGVIPKG